MLKNNNNVVAAPAVYAYLCSQEADVSTNSEMWIPYAKGLTIQACPCSRVFVSRVKPESSQETPVPPSPLSWENLCPACQREVLPKLV